MTCANPVAEEILLLLGTYFPGLVFQEKTTGVSTTIKTTTNQPIGILVVVQGRTVAIEIAVALESTVHKTSLRFPSTTYRDELKQTLERLRTAMIVWWGAVGDVLGIDHPSDFLKDPSGPGSLAEGPNLGAKAESK